MSVHPLESFCWHLLGRWGKSQHPKCKVGINSLEEDPRDASGALLEEM